jgi:hypothetical protein
MTSRALARCLLPAAFLAAVSCRGSPGEPATATDPVVVSESVLFGGGHCRTDRDCGSGVCSVGLCFGYLMASIDATRDAMAPRMRAAVADPATRAAMLASLLNPLGDTAADAYLRSRAADALKFFPAETAAPILAGLLGDGDEPVRFFAARALHVLGDRRGAEALEPFRTHASDAVRQLAETALAPSER